MAKSILVVYTKPVAGREGEFDEWYSSVHLPEVLRLEGFVAAKRFKLVPTGESPQPTLPWLALYEVEDGKLEQARAALAAGLESSGAEVHEGRVPALTPSDSLHPERSVAWFEQIAALGGET